MFATVARFISVEEGSLSLYTRRAIAPAIFISFSLASVSIGHASALQRIAAMIDVSRLASSESAGAGVSSLATEVSMAVPAHTVVPATVELLTFSTEITVGVPQEMDIAIEVADESGNIVNTARVHMPAGWQKLGFSGHDASGRELPNGVYFYRVILDDDVMTTRIVINR
jgi:hypothetical protein